MNIDELAHEVIPYIIELQSKANRCDLIGLHDNILEINEILNMISEKIETRTDKNKYIQLKYKYRDALSFYEDHCMCSKNE